MKKIFFLVLLLLTSCSTLRKVEYKEIPVEVVKKEYIQNTIIDSIFVRDSVDRWRSNDTVFIYKEHTNFKYSNRIDTILKIDTIPQVINHNITKEVEVNKLNWWQKTMIWVGVILSILLILYIIYKVIVIVYKAKIK